MTLMELLKIATFILQTIAMIFLFKTFYTLREKRKTKKKINTVKLFQDVAEGKVDSKTAADMIMASRDNRYAFDEEDGLIANRRYKD